MFHIQLGYTYLAVFLHKCGYLFLFGAFLRYLGIQCLYGWRYQLWRGANQCCVLLLQLCSRYEVFFFQQPWMRRHPSECEFPIGADELRIAVVHHAGKKLRGVWDRTLATYLTFGNEWSLCHANPL